VLGGAWISLSLIGYIPGLEGKSIAEQILQFLATFGSGNSFRGLVVIGLTCSLGVLFDTYAFYRYKACAIID